MKGRLPVAGGEEPEEDRESREAAYRKGVDVVVVLNVKQSHGTPGAPPPQLGLVFQKLQHTHKKKKDSCDCSQ